MRQTQVYFDLLSVSLKIPGKAIPAQYEEQLLQPAPRKGTESRSNKLPTDGKGRQGAHQERLNQRESHAVESETELPSVLHESMAPDWMRIHPLIASALRMKPQQEGRKTSGIPWTETFSKARERT